MSHLSVIDVIFLPGLIMYSSITKDLSEYLQDISGIILFVSTGLQLSPDSYYTVVWHPVKNICAHAISKSLNVFKMKISQTNECY